MVSLQMLRPKGVRLTEVDSCAAHLTTAGLYTHRAVAPRALHKTIANTSITPITVQTIALPRSPANQNPLAALKQRIALVHPLTNAPGLLSIFRIFIGSFYD